MFAFNILEALKNSRAFGLASTMVASVMLEATRIIFLFFAGNLEKDFAALSFDAVCCICVNLRRNSWLDDVDAAISSRGRVISAFELSPVVLGGVAFFFL